MKIFIKIIPLIVFVCVSIQAGRGAPVYKTADFRQQKRTAIKTAQYLEKWAAAPSKRELRRHPFKSTVFSSKQRALFVGLTLMCLTPCVIAALPDTSSAPSMIYTVPYFLGEETRTYGSCDNTTLPGNHISCGSIGENLTVTRCVHPNITEYKNALAACAAIPNLKCHPVSYCISYDIDRVKGDQAVYRPINLTATSEEADQECAATPQTHRIADEAVALLAIKNYMVTIDFMGKAFTSTIFDEPEDFGKRMKYLLPNGTLAYCAVPVTKIKKEKYLPTFISIIKGLGANLNLPEIKIPSITVVHDQICAQQIQQEKGLKATGTYRAFKGRSNLETYASFLQGCSDKEQASVIGHELFHIVQPIGDWSVVSKVENNVELEADLVSILATNSPCIAAYHKKVYMIQFPLPIITRENAAEKLKPQEQYNVFFTHPLEAPRISFDLTMSIHDKRTIAYLIEFLRKNPQWFEIIQ